MDAGLVVITGALCFVSSLFPLVNTEVYLVGVAIALPPPTVALVVVAATLGQMTGKCVLFFAGRGLVKLDLGRAERTVARLRKRVSESSRWQLDALLFASGSVGLPPLFVVSVLAGSTGVALPRFVVLAGTGRLVRFSAVAMFPKLVLPL